MNLNLLTLQRDRHVTTLDMARNNLNEKTMAYIVELCKKNPRVQELVKFLKHLFLITLPIVISFL